MTTTHAATGSRFATRAIHAGQAPDPTTGAVMMPIYATSTYVQASPGVHKGFEYARTPEPDALGLRALRRRPRERHAGLRLRLGPGGDRHRARAARRRRPRRRQRRPLRRHLPAVRARCASARPGSTFSFVDLTDLAAVEAAIRPETQLVWVETPTNPLLKLVDLAAVAALARARGMLAVADNTFASP